MLRFLAALIFATQIRSYFLPTFSASIAEKPQHFCRDHIPPSTHFPESYGAIVCGLSLPPGPQSYELQSSGLIHLLVVSGSHLVFLSFILSRFGIRHRALTSIFLFFFTLFSGFQPPVFRAWLQMHFQFLNSRYRWFGSPSQLVLLCGLTTLLLFPEWSESLSFILSWACGLALSLTKRSSTALGSAVRVYVVLFPILLIFGAPHPISILMNAIFGPLLGFLLFPATLLTFLIPSIVPFTDSLWSGFYWIQTPFGSLPRNESYSIPLLALWAWVLFVHLCYELRRGRS